MAEKIPNVSSFTSVNFFKKLAGRLASAIARTLMLRMMAYVTRFIELTEKIPVIFRVLVHSELSNLPLTCTKITGATDFVS